MAILTKVLKGRSNLGNFVKSTRKEDLILATCSKSAIHTQSTSCNKDDIGGLQQNIPTVVPFWQNWPTRSKSNLFHRKEVLRKVTHEFLRKNCYAAWDPCAALRLKSSTSAHCRCKSVCMISAQKTWKDTFKEEAAFSQHKKILLQYLIQ